MDRSHVDGAIITDYNANMAPDEPMSATVIKRVKQGWLEGERRELVTKDGHYFSFKGIPYAKPPLGALRFKAPEPPVSWEGIRNATKHAPFCIQRLEQKKSCTVTRGSEDCLYLNVYTPDMEPKNPIPVMVFIHGGGLMYGSGDDEEYGPDFIVKQNVILVTFNYRLSSLGLLCLDTKEVPGNAAFKDQVFALRWVQNNIADFGGDHNNITLFGESAAGVALHVISPLSSNLFSRAILLGGVPMGEWSLDSYPQSKAATLAYLMGLEEENPDANLLFNFLQSLPVEHLILKAPCLYRTEDIHNFVFNMSHFPPAVEKDFGQERFLVEDPQESLRKGNINKVDVMVGYANMSATDTLTHKDWALQIYTKAPELFVPRRILKDASRHKILDAAIKIRNFYFGEKPNSQITIKEFVKYISDCSCLLGTHRYMRHLSYTFMGRPAIYFFRFCGVSERSYRGASSRKEHGISGSGAHDLMAHLFDPKEANLTIDKSSKGYRMTQTLSYITTNFAKIGKPFVDDCYSEIVWCEYDYFTESYMDVDETLTPGDALNDQVLDFWKSLYEFAEVKLDI